MQKRTSPLLTTISLRESGSLDISTDSILSVLINTALREGAYVAFQVKGNDCLQVV
jgi:hypothetical protein